MNDEYDDDDDDFNQKTTRKNSEIPSLLKINLDIHEQLTRKTQKNQFLPKRIAFLLNNSSLPPNFHSHHFFSSRKSPRKVGSIHPSGNKTLPLPCENRTTARSYKPDKGPKINR